MSQVAAAKRIFPVSDSGVSQTMDQHQEGSTIKFLYLTIVAATSNALVTTYKYDSTSIRRSFAYHSTAIRPRLYDHFIIIFYYDTVMFATLTVKTVTSVLV